MRGKGEKERQARRVGGRGVSGRARGEESKKDEGGKWKSKKDEESKR